MAELKYFTRGAVAYDDKRPRRKSRSRFCTICGDMVPNVSESDFRNSRFTCRGCARPARESSLTRGLATAAVIH